MNAPSASSDGSATSASSDAPAISALYSIEKSIQELIAIVDDIKIKTKDMKEKITNIIIGPILKNRNSVMRNIRAMMPLIRNIPESRTLESRVNKINNTISVFLININQVLSVMDQIIRTNIQQGGKTQAKQLKSKKIKKTRKYRK
jgi:hypothetical protein